ncbi:MAG: hypothetical protein ABSH06_29805 [Thermodesulfobacteriota bacterium]|jgi:hypothetical protein
MAANPEMSKKTWERIDELLHEIMHRARKIRDDEIYRKADQCTALLRNLSMEILMEDEKAAEQPK